MNRVFIFLLLLSGNRILLQPPRGLDLYMPVPETNPLTRENIELGRRLFFDKQLSLDRTLSCASCHDPKRAFSDGRRVARGIHGLEGKRNTPTLINRGYGQSFFADGRAPTIELQISQPILNPIELGMSESEILGRTGLPLSNVADALASYVRTIRSGDSRFDRYAAGRLAALTPLEKEGLEVFRGKGRCVVCHPTPNFTDEQFHNTGVAWRDGRLADDGRFAVTGEKPDRGAFKTPTLREVARTAPYMHDGSFATLEEVVSFYSDGGRPNPEIDREIRPRNFTPAEKSALVAFLRSLSGHIVEGFEAAGASTPWNLVR